MTNKLVGRLSPELCRKHPGLIFVFGDNTIRKGKMGQACIRDCPNSFGVVTKKYPGWSDKDYLKDSHEDKEMVLNDLEELRILSNKRVLVFPKDGLGTGLADLKNRAPNLLYFINSYIKEHFDVEFN